uniref:Uncharacterized protein n=1 Tax=Glossina austeni TaxID=7395 RepID=A0A1A9UNN6_GLOAU
MAAEYQIHGDDDIHALSCSISDKQRVNFAGVKPILFLKLSIAALAFLLPLVLLLLVMLLAFYAISMLYSDVVTTFIAIATINDVTTITSTFTATCILFLSGLWFS